MFWEHFQGQTGWLLATAIGFVVAAGSVVTDFFVRRHRRRFLADLMGHLGLASANQFSEEIDQITRAPVANLFVVPVVLFAGISAIGLHYALLPSEDAPFLKHNIFVFSAQFGAADQIMTYQLKAITALVAGFIGAYGFCLYWFYQDIRAGRFSPGTLIVASGTIVAASIATVVLWHAIAAVGAAPLVSFSNSTLFVVSVIAGAVIARPGPQLLRRLWLRLWVWRGLLRPSRTLHVIDGLDVRTRRQLALLHINDVQNLATASPLLLAAATDVGLSEIIDWIGQARMVLRVDDQAQVDSLRARSVRTIFHLVDAAKDEGAAEELGRVLLHAAPAPPSEPNKQLEAPGPSRNSGGSLILRIAETERADPQFQRLEAIRSATGVAAAAQTTEKAEQATASLEAPAGFSVVRTPKLTMRRWIEHGTGDPVTKLAFTVDLVGEPGGAPDIGRWSTLDVKVRLSSPAVEFEDEEGIVLVQQGDLSLPCHIIGTLHSDDVTIRVRALFYVGARYSGALVETFPVAAAVGADVLVVPAPDERQPPGPMTFMDGEADLTVTVQVIDPKNPAHQRWRLDSPKLKREHGYKGSRIDDRVIMDDPAEFFARYRTILATPDAAQLRRLLRGLGGELWSKSPKCFQDAYWFLRQLKPDFSIQFMTDDGQTPVELMMPSRLGRDEDLLSMMHPMARWALPRWDNGLGGDLVPRIPRGMVAAMAPNYIETNLTIPNLPAIRSSYEGRDAQWFDGATGVLLSLLQSSHPVRLLMFYGHGKAGSPKEDSHLVMADAILRVREIDTSDTTLGWRYKTLIVLNACSTGAGALGSVAEWPTILMKRGFAGIVAPLWDVDTFEAHRVALKLHDDIVKGNQRIGQSLREQKAKAFIADGVPAALAYVFHGDVTARME